MVEPGTRLVLTAGACPLDADGAAGLGDHDPPSTLLGVAVLG
ncbi:hypothetical protein [Geodermatophilus dictyosporus]|nr:hypothetical protein [Geodermatophilus dictyosporus]